MSDYSQVTDFSDKDALTTGDPEKAISGADVDGEFDAISTAIASKIDEPVSPTTGDILVWSGSAWAAKDTGIDGEAGQARITDGTNDDWGSVVTVGTYTDLTSGSPTSVDFTGIPDWVKEVNLLVVAGSFDVAAGFSLLLGDSGGMETTGYTGQWSAISSATASSGGNSTSWLVGGAGLVGTLTTISARILLADAATNMWVISSQAGETGGLLSLYCVGEKSLSGTLTQLRIGSSNGTSVFDSGNAVVTYF